MGAAMALRASMARSARYSWTKPITALRMTMAIMAMVSVASPSSPEITPAASRTRIMKSLNWPRSS